MKTMLVPLLVVAAIGFAAGVPAAAQVAALSEPAGESETETVRDGGWIITRSSSGDQLHTMELTLTPRGEPRPALKYQFLPSDFDLLDGNAALYYLKAMGFLEQDPARDQFRQFYRNAAEQSRTQDKPIHQFPPYSWLSMMPDQLPLEEVKQYLVLTSFQPQFLEEARRRRRFDMDRNFREVDDPIAYLLPEIQSMRELARMQSLRCKVAIAEGRLDDAVAILGQQHALARHLGQDVFLVSNLVGVACAGIAWDDLLYLVEQPDAPNLYWALASLPRPLVDIRYPLATEREFLYLQLKVLREVDETPRPAGYWQDFLDRLAAQAGYFSRDLGLPEDDPQTARALLVGYVAAAYPGAKRYLIEDCGMAREKVEAYPTAQVAFLAAVRFYDEARDEIFKWTYLPYWQSEAEARGRDSDIWEKGKRIGWSAAPAMLLLPAVRAARTAIARCEQQLNLVQAVEAIRMYGAAHEGKLPPTLDDLPVPAPLEPISGKPLEYELQGDQAVLLGHELPGLRYRLVLRFAKPQ